jgi:hypothetical protein
MSGPVVTQEDRDLWDELLYIWRMEFDPDGHRAIARHREQATTDQAAHIAALEARCEALAGALEPFAEMAKYLDNTEARRDAIYCGGVPGLRCEVKKSDYHRARAELAKYEAMKGVK